MVQTNRIKWLVTIFLAAIVLVLALVGGKWGTSFAAGSEVLTPPVIDHLDPAFIPVRSPTRTIVIVGAFLDQCGMWVRLTGPGFDVSIEPKSIVQGGISVDIDSKYFLQPNIYTLYVVHSRYCTVPPFPDHPYLPDYDEISNAVTLTVFQPEVEIFLPICRVSP